MKTAGHQNTSIMCLRFKTTPRPDMLIFSGTFFPELNHWQSDTWDAGKDTCYSFINQLNV